MRLLRRTMLTLSVLALAALCVVLFLLRTGENQENTSILSNSSFNIENTLSGQSVRVFTYPEINYLFVPYFSDGMTFVFNADHAKIDGDTYFSGDKLNVKEMSGTHTVCFYDADGSELEKDNLDIEVSAEIPTVFISTATGTYSTQQDKMHKEYCTIEIVNPDGSEEYANEHPLSDVIRGHGNSTWVKSDKKPYNLYLQFASDLFGMGEAEKWVMLANVNDLTGIRNKLVYDYAADFGLEFSPESEFVDMYFDGLYHGTYLLCENVQNAKNRVDIGNNGILFTMEVDFRLTGKDNDYISKHGQRLVRLSPEPNNGTWVERFREIIDKFEDAIFTDFTLDELSRYIDIESWAKMIIIEDLFSNYDAWATSQYFYIKPDSDIIYAGPVWDFDYSTGNAPGLFKVEKSNAVNVLAYNSEMNYLSEETPWVHRLMQNVEFRDYVASVFEQEVCPGLEEYVEKATDEYIGKIEASRHTNAVRWYLPEGTPENYMKSFISQRLEFFKRIWVDCEPFNFVTYMNTGMSLAYFEGEECPADMFGYRWFFDKEHTAPAGPFVPEHDTYLYSDSENLALQMK